MIRSSVDSQTYLSRGRTAATGGRRADRPPRQGPRGYRVARNTRPLKKSDFTALPTTCKFIALMPQWDFLDFLAARGRRYAGFHLLMKAEATELIEERGQIVGLRGIAEGGLIDIRANLVIGADGRHST